MSLLLFTDKEKLKEIERQIVGMKEFRLIGEERRQVDILKSIANDMRARLPGGYDHAVVQLERLLALCERYKTNSGYRESTLIDLAQHVIGLWPTLRAALVDAKKETV